MFAVQLVPNLNLNLTYANLNYTNLTYANLT